MTTNNPSKNLVQEIEKDKVSVIFYQKINSFHPKVNKKDEKEKKEKNAAKYSSIKYSGKFYEERLQKILEREKLKAEVYSQAKKELEDNVSLTR